MNMVFSNIWTLLCILLGTAGLILWGHTVFILLFKPVRRDLILIEGFMWRVIGLVLSVPFIATTIIILCNQASMSHLSVYELVYSEDFYHNQTEATDQCTPIPLNGQLDRLGIVDSLLLTQAGYDNIIIKNDTLKLGRHIRHNHLPEHIHQNQTDPSLLWTVFYHFIDPGNQHMTTSESGRRWAAILSILGVFLLNGLLITTLISIIDRRKEQWRRGEVRYSSHIFGLLSPLHNYSVIIGSHDMATSLVSQIIKNNRYIIIMTEQNIEDFRSTLYSVIPHHQRKKIILYYGKRTSEKDIASLRLECANEIYLLGENAGPDDIASNHDTLNMQCLRLIASYITKHQDKKLRCRVMFEYQTAFSILQFSDLCNEIRSCIDFRPFNFYEMWAQQVFVCPQTGKLSELSVRYLPLEGTRPITAQSDDYVHLIIVGMSRMGVALAIEAAHIAHYPNFITKQKRTRITLIDSNARQEMNFFMGRFEELFAVSRWRYAKTDSNNTYHIPSSQLFANNKWFDPLTDEHSASPYKSSSNYLGLNFIDVEWEFIEGGIEESQVQNYLKLSASETNARVTVAVCLPQPNQVVAAAIYLPDEIYRNSIQILAYQRDGSAILDSISQNNKYYCKIRSFGMTTDCYDVKLISRSEHIAAIFMDKYKEMSDKIWQSLPQYDTTQEIVRKKTEMAKWWSNVYNANTMWTKLRSFEYTGEESIEDNNELIARTEHNRWNMEQLLMRFRPLTEDEQKSVISQPDGQRKAMEKERLKGEMAHLDICSWERLQEIDPSVTEYDKGLTDILPHIHKVLSLTNDTKNEK